MLNNNNFWYVFDLMLSMLELSIFFYFINDNSIKKRSNKIIWLTFIIFVITIIIVNTMNIHLISNGRVTIAIVLSLIFYKLNYNVNIIKCVAGTLMFYMLLISIDSISMVFVKFANGLPNFDLLFEPGLFRLELISITKTLLILATIYSKYFKLLTRITTKDFIYLIIPMITNIFSLFLVFGKDIINLPSRFMQDISFIIISILILFSNMFLVFIILKIIKDNALIEERNLNDKKRIMEYDYYRKVEENNYKVRSLYHDMKNHLVCIGSLCDSDEAMKYVESLKFELNKLDNIYNTGNRVLDIILNEKNQICLEKGIKLSTYIDFSNADFIEMVDINTIFSNAIDNAIQACEKIEDKNIFKKIDLKIKCVNNFYIIKIINSKGHKVIINENKILTNKKDKFLHGFGISNIKLSVEKYNGETVTDYTENEYILTILIPFPT